jgi:TolC family type I secretion outer membrane protein
MWFTAAQLQRNRRHPDRLICLAGFLTLFVVCRVGAGDLAPPTPDKSWLPANEGTYEQELAGLARTSTNGVAIDPAKTYDLPALIDIAERSHPETRVAWEAARAQAQAVGLSESTYYPYLAALASENFAHELSVVTSVFPGNVVEESAGVELNWLLFDFGGRAAQVAGAREKLMAANVNFNATHQKIVFELTKSFYDYNIARQQVEASESSLQAARVVSDAARARFENGLATKPDVLQAEQQTAQADYDLEAARGALGDAQVALVNSLGIFPAVNVQVAQTPAGAIDEKMGEPLDELVDRALSQRPDLLATLANLKASQAAVREARAAYYPKISLDASAGWSKLDVNAYDSPYVGNDKPNYAAGISLEWPIFEGFARRDRLRMAESELKAAASELADNRDNAVQEVMKAYVDLQTALRKQDAAEVLLASAQSAFDAALESYKQGLGTYVDVANAQRNLASARSTVVEARSEIYTSKTGLALSVGDLARPVADSTPPP